MNEDRPRVVNGQPLDYEPPRREKPSTLRFFGGLVLGCVLAGAAEMLGVVLMQLTYARIDRVVLRLAIAVVPLAAVLLTGIALTVRSRHRSFGIGVIVAVPVTVLTTLVLCGGMR